MAKNYLEWKKDYLEKFRKEHKWSSEPREHVLESIYLEYVKESGEHEETLKKYKEGKINTMEAVNEIVLAHNTKKIKLKDIQEKLPKVKDEHPNKKIAERLVDKEVVIWKKSIAKDGINIGSVRYTKIEDVKWNPKKINDNEIELEGHEDIKNVTIDELLDLVHKGSAMTGKYYIHVLRGVKWYPSI